MRNELIYYMVLCAFSFFLFSCGSGYQKRDVEHLKCVLAKEKVWNDEQERFQVAFTDGSDAFVPFGLYSITEVGDTLTFVCGEGLSVNKWNCYIKKKDIAQ